MSITNLNHKNYKRNIFLLLLSFTAIILFTFITIDYFFFKQFNEEKFYKNAYERFEYKENLLKDNFTANKNMLIALNNSKSFKKYLKNKDKTEIKELFFNFANSNSNIMQLRYIDKNGLEQIRIDRKTDSSKPKILEDNKLQDKSNRYYFKESILKKDIWLTNFDLNFEDGKLQTPFVPTIRVIKPILENKKFKGILIANYFVEELLENFSKDLVFDLYLLDSKGNVIISSNEDLNWEAFTGMYKSHIEKNFGKNFKTLLENKHLNKNYLLKKLDINTQNPIYLVLKTKKEVLEKAEKEKVKEFILVGIIVFLISISFLYLVGKLIFNIVNTIDEQNEELEFISSELTTRNNFLDNLLDNIEAVVALIDTKGTMFSVNAYTEKITGFTQDEIASKPYFWFEKFIPSEIKFDIKDVFNQIIENNNLVPKKENEWIIKNGEKRLFEWSNKVIYENNEAKYLLTVGIDITERKKLQVDLENKIILVEEALRKTKIAEENAQVALEESRVSEEEALASQEELLKIQDQLIKANEAKSEFLANMSHEIRTPLNGIIGITDLILEEKELSKKVKENLQIVHNSSNSLRGIINDILDFSKIQAGKFEIHPKEFSLQNLLNELRDLYQPLAIQKNLDFKVTLENKAKQDTIIADSLRLKQIIGNLLSNAIKFTKIGYIQLDAKVHLNNEKVHLEFNISDTGIGMNEKIQKNLFKEFTQGEDSNTKEHQGTGLGLSISKSLTELMNGKISFTSAKNCGTKFTLVFSFDYEKNKVLDKKENFYNIKLKNRKKALIAEDNDVNQIVIDKLLKNIGFETTFADDGLDAVALFQDRKFDIIFMDIQMPNMDGYEATKIIRDLDKETPIIAVSAAVMTKDKETSKNVGMNKHISKPIDKKELNKVIEEYFETTKEKIDEQSLKEIQEPKPINLKDFMEELDLDKETAYMLIEKFYDKYKNIEEDLQNQSIEDIDKYIHSLKGASGNLRAYELFELVNEIYARKEYEKLKLIIEKTKKLCNYIKNEIISKL